MRWVNRAVAVAIALVVGYSATAGRGDAHGASLYDQTDPTLRGAALEALNLHGLVFTDFAPTKPTGPKLIDDAIPRVMIVFWDGRAGADPDHPVTEQVESYLKRGLPVTLGINPGTIGTGTGVNAKLTWDEVRELMATANFHRSRIEQTGSATDARLHFIHHSTNNLPDLYSMTHGDFVAEWDASVILRETGYRVRVAGTPGDSGRWDWWRRNLEYAGSVLDSLGIWYTTTGNRADSSAAANFLPSSALLHNYAAAPGNYIDRTGNRYGGRPGMMFPRHDIPAAIGDLGQIVVERVASSPADYALAESRAKLGHFLYGHKHITGVEPPNGDGFSLAANGATASGAAYLRTFAYAYSRALAMNYGFSLGFHDAKAPASQVPNPPTGISAEEYVAGAQSHEHIAWALAMLERKGHIKVVGPEEYAEWITGEWAPGTDLISNPRCLVPQFDIGDTLGWTSEYAWPRGLSSIGHAMGGQSASLYPVQNLTALTTGGIAKWDSSGVDPQRIIGASVPGVRGRPGGVRLASDGASVLRIANGNLTPGRYDLSFSFNTSTATGTFISGFSTAAMVRGFKMVDGLGNDFATAYNDTLYTWLWKDDTVQVNMTGSTNRWGDWKVPLHFPKQLMGDQAGLRDFGSGTEAANGSRFEPYDGEGSDSAFLPLIASSRWGFSLSIFINAGHATISNPRLIYLGD